MAAEEWGVLSLAELRACGLTDRAVSRRLRAGHLHRLHRGVYAVGHPSVSLEGRILAAVKACGPGAVASHFAAAALHRYVEWEDRLIDVTILGSTRAHHGIKVHRTARLDPRDRLRVNGIPCTSAARTALDLAAVMHPRGYRRAIRQAQSMHRVHVRQLAEVHGRLAPCRGSGRLAGLIAHGPTPTRSELEDVVLAMILAGGFARPDVNELLRIEGRRVIPDFRWPAQRLVLEADGAAWHENKLARADDAERQALLEASGERVLRVTWDQAILRRDETLARLAAARAPLQQAIMQDSGEELRRSTRTG